MNQMHSKLGLLAAMCLLIAGCNKPAPNTSATPTGPKPFRAAMVTDTAGLTDRSFNETSWKGLQKAQKDLGIEIKAVESRAVADYETNLSLLARQGYDVIFAIGFAQFDPLSKVAKQFPKTKFAIVDTDAPKLPNCKGLVFREQEGCFLAGALAAMVSKSGKLGFVGGLDIPLIKRFEVGYHAGALAVNPKIELFAGYAGSWEDPTKGKELALSQIERGADIVFTASGKTGLGVIEAARTKGPGYYAIGTDADQDYIAPGRVLTSMMKGLDSVVYNVTADVKNGKYKADNQSFGLKEDGVRLSPMKYTRDKIPAGALKRIEVLKQAIISGAIKVPVDDAGLKAFAAAK